VASRAAGIAKPKPMALASPETVRRLATLRPSSGAVVSLYLDLDPSELATAEARSSAIRSLIDQAGREAELRSDLSHQERMALREDVTRIADRLKRMSFQGARGVALFTCGPAGLLEEIKLERPVPSKVVIDRHPHVEPLLPIAERLRWCLALVNRSTARFFEGSEDRLEEVAEVRDEVHGKHDQGGWSQARYQRSVEKEAEDHLRRVAEALRARFKRAPFDRLLLGGPTEALTAFERLLHPDLQQKLAGRLDVDVQSPGPEQVRQAAADAFATERRRRERDLLDRIRSAIGGANGAGAAGLPDVLAALNEKRVGTLAFSDSFHQEGYACRECGWLSADPLERCPIDGSQLDQRDDLREDVVEAALAQGAEVVLVSEHRDLDPLGGTAALLRF
jgi:peptide chain release factor subunit 1